jgi:hypothetical protein
MSGFHGMFSLGGMAGGGLEPAAPAGVSPGARHLVARGHCVRGLAASRFMLRQTRQAEPARAPLSLPRGPLAAARRAGRAGPDRRRRDVRLERALPAAGARRADRHREPRLRQLQRRDGGRPLRRRLGARPHAAGDAAARQRRAGRAGMALALAVPHPGAALVGFALVGLGSPTSCRCCSAPPAGAGHRARARHRGGVVGRLLRDDGRPADDRLHRRGRVRSHCSATSASRAPRSWAPASARNTETARRRVWAPPVGAAPASRRRQGGSSFSCPYCGTFCVIAPGKARGRQNERHAKETWL